jgi:transmembrane sensor
MNGKDDSAHGMNRRKERDFLTRKGSVRELIAQEAADWFVANREGLDSTQSATFAAWLRASPQNIEEYMNIASIGRDVRVASGDPTVSFEDLMKRALETEDPGTIVRRPESPQAPSSRARPVEWRGWRLQAPLLTAIAVAAIGIVTLAFLFWKNSGRQSDGNIIAYSIQTRHGEQLTRQLPDNSILKLDTDTSVLVRFDSTQRLVKVFRGRADFKVAHEPARQFVVQARSVSITDVGTEFDVYAQPDSTLVTVLQGRVAVAADPLALSVGAQGSGVPPPSYAPVQVIAGQQVRVDNDSWPPIYMPVDTQRATAWLRRQIVFQNEPLERVAAEFNRYAATPIQIDSPPLRTLTVSGVFTADDTESFIDFLRSLDGVQVEVTATRIRISRK